MYLVFNIFFISMDTKKNLFLDRPTFIKYDFYNLVINENPCSS